MFDRQKPHLQITSLIMENKDKHVASSSSSSSLRIKTNQLKEETSGDQVSGHPQISEGPTAILQSTTVNEEVTTNEDDAVCNLPPAPPHFNYPIKPKVIFVLDKASLVPALVGTRWRILNSHRHSDYLRLMKLDPSSYRPDIVHNALLEIIGSRLCRAGRVEAIYVNTDKGVLIRVNPRAHIPESMGKFCSMMLHVLQNPNVYTMNNRHGYPVYVDPYHVTDRLPLGSFKIGLSFSSKKKCQLEDYVSSMLVRSGFKLVFVVGAMAHGEIESCYTHDLIAVSKYRLSTATCVQQINNALEKSWKAW